MKTSSLGRITRTARVPMLWLAASASFAASAPGSPRTTPPATARAAYRIDSTTSRLTVQTETAGLSSIFGHDHRFDARDFSGKLTLVPGEPESAALDLEVRGDALILLEDVSDDMRREIAAALRDAVLETPRYPEIAFHSRGISAKKGDAGSFDVKLAGELALHGVRRNIVVPAHVAPTADGYRATGVVDLRQSDFKIKTYTFAKGTVKVRDSVAISFDLLARK